MSERPVVVKIGGSLARSVGALERVTALVARARRGIAVVPGGGSFADAVRRAQAEFGFDDVAAHRMAILAMHQTGLMLASLVPDLRICEDLDDIAERLRAEESLVWLPLKACDHDAALPPSWDTTSDAIAARLAERLGGLEVVFIKSRSASAGKPAGTLADEGIIDPVAARIIEEAGLSFEVIAADQEARLCQILGVSMQVDVPPAPC